MLHSTFLLCGTGTLGLTVTPVQAVSWPMGCFPMGAKRGQSRVLVTGSIDSPRLGERWPRPRIHPGCPSRNKRRWAQRQGWRQGSGVDLRSMQGGRARGGYSYGIASAGTDGSGLSWNGVLDHGQSGARGPGWCSSTPVRPLGALRTLTFSEEDVFLLQDDSCAVAVQFYQKKEIEVVSAAGNAKSTLSLLPTTLQVR